MNCCLNFFLNNEKTFERMLSLIQKSVFKDCGAKQGIICLDPLIQFIPSESKSKDAKSPKVSIQVTKKSIGNHYLLCPSDDEAFVKFIHSYNSILEAKGYLKNIEKTKANIVALRKDEKVVEADKFSSEMYENIQNALSLYESLLTAGSRGDWSQIVIHVFHKPKDDGDSTIVLSTSLRKSNLTLST